MFIRYFNCIYACRGHDRALPEIPATASGVASTDDDDEEDEGHYDVISKNRRMASLTPLPNVIAPHGPKLTDCNNPQLKRGNHPYEKVRGDPDSESATYAGIPDNFPPPSRTVARNSNLPQQSVQPRNEQVAVPADPLYSGVSDEAFSDSTLTCDNGAILQPPVYSMVGDRARTNLVRDNLNDACSSLCVTPPVPNRCYELRDYADGQEDSSICTGGSSLPPLHSANMGETGSSWSACGTTASSRSAVVSSPVAGPSVWSTNGQNSHPLSGEFSAASESDTPAVLSAAAAAQQSAASVPTAPAPGNLLIDAAKEIYPYYLFAHVLVKIIRIFEGLVFVRSFAKLCFSIYKA